MPNLETTKESKKRTHGSFPINVDCNPIKGNRLTNSKHILVNFTFGLNCLENEKIICTPHLGASTAEAQEKVAVQIAEQMSDFLLTGAITNAINFPSVSAEEATSMEPYLILAKNLGSFAGQITESALKSAKIEYVGSIADMNVESLT